MPRQDLSQIDAIFLDDGGVMTDNERRGRQFRRFLADYLRPRFGGDTSAWEAANLEVIGRQLPLYIDGTGFPAKGGYLPVWRRLQIEWLRDMCAIVGVTAPRDDERCFETAWETMEYVVPRVRASYPGATAAIQALHAKGYRLYTASGTHSHDLRLYLEGMGVRELFGRTYGPDLIDTHKASRHYYEGILADAGVTPARALIVDDSPRATLWATEAGASALLIASEPPAELTMGNVLRSLADLPTFLVDITD